MCIVQANDVLGINDGNVAQTSNINVLYPPQLGKPDGILYIYIYKYTHTHTHTHSGPLLIIHFKYNSVDMSIPNFQAIPTPHPPSLYNHKFIL